jgi:hypothetical protein
MGTAGRVVDIANSWSKVSIELSTVITLTNQVVFRFVACDIGTPGLTEAAIDDFALEAFAPNPAATPDVRTNGSVSRLAQNQPNPFRPEEAVTTITFRLSNPAPARLEIYDTSGRLVRTLVDAPLPPGVHNIAWNGLDDAGNPVGSGVYFYRLNAGAFEQSRRMTILR